MADRRPRLALVAEEHHRRSGLDGDVGQHPARRDRDAGRAPIQCGPERPERLFGPARVRRSDDERFLVHPGRQYAIPVDDEGHPETVGARRPDDVRADRRAAHAEDDDGARAPTAPEGQRLGRGDTLGRATELIGERGDGLEHRAPVDRGPACGVVEDGRRLPACSHDAAVVVDDGSLGGIGPGLTGHRAGQPLPGPGRGHAPLTSCSPAAMIASAIAWDVASV